MLMEVQAAVSTLGRNHHQENAEQKLFKSVR